MHLLDQTVRGARLCIACAGEYGVGSQGNPSGQLVKELIAQTLARENATLVEVVIDFRNVQYVWGDGPAWSVLPAIRAGLPVRYLASGENAPALSNLVAFSGLTEWIVVETGPTLGEPPVAPNNPPAPTSHGDEPTPTE